LAISRALVPVRVDSEINLHERARENRRPLDVTAVTQGLAGAASRAAVLLVAVMV
jgi:hypothetical protein